jgi:hypothetical protein
MAVKRNFDKQTRKSKTTNKSVRTFTWIQYKGDQEQHNLSVLPLTVSLSWLKQQTSEQLNAPNYSNVADTVRIREVVRARICKRFRSPEIDSEESITPAFVAWQAGTTYRVVVPAWRNRFLGSLKVYKFGHKMVSKSYRSQSRIKSNVSNIIHYMNR